MKKILIIATLVVASTVASYSQGLVSIALNGGTLISTNGPTSTGKITGSSTYYFGLLISSNLGLVGTTANNILDHPSLLASFWDAGLTGVNGTGISAGKITAGGSVAATSWAAPGVSYDNPMAYIIVGWSAVYGTTWTQVANLINGAGLAPGGYFGNTLVAENYAGGGTALLPAINLWLNPTATVGFGVTGGLILNQVPEPTTIALAGLGALSLLLFRRRQ